MRPLYIFIITQARILSSEFKNLSSADAAIWQKASEEDKARHDREMAAHNSTAPPSAPLLPIPNHPPPPPPPVQVSGGDSTLINHQNDNNDDNDRTVPVQVSHDDLLTTSMVDEKEEVEAEEETVVAVMAPKAKRVKKPRKMKGMFPESFSFPYYFISALLCVLSLHGSLVLYLCFWHCHVERSQRPYCSQGKRVLNRS